MDVIRKITFKWYTIHDVCRYLYIYVYIYICVCFVCIWSQTWAFSSWFWCRKI
jgi:hypothetical protein